jgi:hypothetical protein
LEIFLGKESMVAYPNVLGFFDIGTAYSFCKKQRSRSVCLRFILK